MERIVAILEKINRPGMGQVIDYMRKSNYATARCNSHHTYKGGLVDHSLEVYNLMLERRGNISEESIAICAFLHDLGRVKYDVVTDDETIDAFFTLSRLEGIIPAIESAHAVAYGIKLAQRLNKGSVLINLSGRGDKDMDYVIEKYGIR